MGLKTGAGSAQPTLRRSLSLPLLVLYGLGTTIGAGIYALTGKIAALGLLSDGRSPAGSRSETLHCSNEQRLSLPIGEDKRGSQREQHNR